MLQHVVYMVTIDREELPNKYIGSKTNCYYEDGVLYASNGKPYWGSSTDVEYHDLIMNDDIVKKIEILAIEPDPYSVLCREREIHLERDVTGDPSYFNRAVAQTGGFNQFGHGTFKHTVSGKIAKLPVDHPGVISGEWVGVTKGTKMSPERLARYRKWRRDNPDLNRGRKRSEEELQTLREAQRKMWDSLTEEEDRERRQRLSETAKKTFTGRPQSEEHIRKRSEYRSGKFSIINNITKELKLVTKEEFAQYDHEVWQTLVSYNREGTTKYINIDTGEVKYLKQAPSERWMLLSEYNQNRVRGTKTCVECGSSYEYTKRTLTRTTCSEECSSKLRSRESSRINAKRRKYRNVVTGEERMLKEAPESSDWVWWSDPDRIIATKCCIICGEEYHVLNKERYIRETCSRECTDRLSSKRRTNKGIK